MKIEMKLPVVSYSYIGLNPETRVPGYNPVIIIDNKKFTCNTEYTMTEEELNKFIEEFNESFGENLEKKMATKEEIIAIIREWGACHFADDSEGWEALIEHIEQEVK